MTDREQIIKDFEHAVNKARGDYYDYVDLTVEDADEILKLLKDQKAVPVIQREVAHMLFWCCSSCGVAITDGDKFCRNCGKELKW